MEVRFNFYNDLASFQTAVKDNIIHQGDLSIVREPGSLYIGNNEIISGSKYISESGILGDIDNIQDIIQANMDTYDSIYSPTSASIDANGILTITCKCIADGSTKNITVDLSKYLRPTAGEGIVVDGQKVSVDILPKGSEDPVGLIFNGNKLCCNYSGLNRYMTNIADRRIIEVSPKPQQQLEDIFYKIQLASDLDPTLLKRNTLIFNDHSHNFELFNMPYDGDLSYFYAADGIDCSDSDDESVAAGILYYGVYREATRFSTPYKPRTPNIYFALSRNILTPLPERKNYISLEAFVDPTTGAPKYPIVLYNGKLYRLNFAFDTSRIPHYNG